MKTYFLKLGGFLLGLQILLLPQTELHATNGYCLLGYSAKNVGLGGAVTAYPQDSMIASVNPAGMYWVGNRLDAGVEVFSPIRRYSFDSPNFGHHRFHSHRNLFPIGNIGFNRCLNSCTTLGVSMYGNGGMNTSYRRNNPVFGQGGLSLDYVQLILAPTIARQIFCNQSIGASLLLAGQRIRLTGLQNFEAFSSAPANVSNHRYNYSGGAGARFGWMGQFFDRLWLGAAYSTKIYTSRFHKYRGLLAEKGSLDIPANWSVGFRYCITPCMNFAFDFQRILYHQVRALGNSITNIAPGNLGRKNGAGFGWKNVSAYRMGLDYTFSPSFIGRIGASFSEIPYSKKQIDPNIIAPAVVSQHYTIGLTYLTQGRSQWDFAYSYSPPGYRSGTSNFGLGTVKHHMTQHYFLLNYSWN